MRLFLTILVGVVSSNLYDNSSYSVLLVLVKLGLWYSSLMNLDCRFSVGVGIFGYEFLVDEFMGLYCEKQLSWFYTFTQLGICKISIPWKSGNFVFLQVFIKLVYSC